jgi:hypothetical protein
MELIKSELAEAKHQSERITALAAARGPVHERVEVDLQMSVKTLLVLLLYTSMPVTPRCAK